MSGLDGVEPTTGAPYGDDYAVPPGCTGYYREDLDWGDVLTHNPHGEPCPVHRFEPLNALDLDVHAAYGRAAAANAPRDPHAAIIINGT